jgi:YD repeat-containing protein
MNAPIRPSRRLACGVLLLVATPALAQQTPVANTGTGTPHYDVVLEVPELSVGEIELLVANLRAHLSLQANAASLVNVSAGAVVSIDSVELGLYGILAEAYLYVDLKNVQRIVRRVVTTLDNNPEILTRVLATADSVLRTVGGVANTALQPGGVASQAVGAVGQTLDNVTRPGGLLSQTVNTLGQTVQQVVTQTGSLVERTLDTTGQLLNERTLGSVLDLPILRTATNTAGQTVRTVRDTAGNLIEVTLDSAGGVAGTRVLGGGR